MTPSEPMPSSLRLAVLALAVSHFESPLFRLCARLPELKMKVFYVHRPKAEVYDSEYAQAIDWGSDLLAGYDSLRVAKPDQLVSAAREWGADVVMIYGYGWPGAPRIILGNWWKGRAQVHRGTLNYHLDPRRGIKGRLMRPLGRVLLRLFDAHHFGGDYSRKVLRDAGADERSFFFVPYSVDSQHFLDGADDPLNGAAADKIRLDLGWEPSDQVMLFIAQHNWFKGPDIAMEVFREVAKSNPKVRLLVLGSGRMTEDMQCYARRYMKSDTYCFAGFVPSAQTIPYYLASDLVICTSRYETWARMVNEAMLCRRPCVVNRVVPAAGGLVEEGENGYVVEAPEAAHYVPVIKRHFSLSADLRGHMGDAAREKAKTFAYEPYVGNVLAAARYALANARRRAVASDSN